MGGDRIGDITSDEGEVAAASPLCHGGDTAQGTITSQPEVEELTAVVGVIGEWGASIDLGEAAPLWFVGGNAEEVAKLIWSSWARAGNIY